MPLLAAIVQELIDAAVILNELARFDPAYGHAGRHMTAAAGRELHRNHVSLIGNLDRLRSIVDTLDDATAQNGAAPIAEANKVVREQVVAHERGDEGNVYPQLVGILKESHSFSAMSRAHREILHLARLLARGALTMWLHRAARRCTTDAADCLDRRA
jgi:hypothetical protein